jgi:hypothetical protein
VWSWMSPRARGTDRECLSACGLRRVSVCVAKMRAIAVGCALCYGTCRQEKESCLHSVSEPPSVCGSGSLASWSGDRKTR